MTEPSDNLESRLFSVRPRPITPSLESRIAHSTAILAPSRAAVSMFWTALAGGAIAASIILIMLTAQNTGPLRPGYPMVSVLNQPSSISNLTTLASADARWGDDLYVHESRRLP